MPKTVTLLSLFLLLIPIYALAGPDVEPTVLLDFETGEPTDGWTIAKLGVFETTVKDGDTPSGGRALGIKGTSRGGHLIHKVSVSDWRTFTALSFFAKVEAEAPVSMRILAAEGSSFRSRLRRFKLAPGGWREVILPLAGFRGDFRRAMGRIDRVSRIVLQWDDGEGSVVIDDLRLLPGDRGERSWLPTEAEYLAQAFPAGDGKALCSEHFLVLTDVPALNEKTARPILDRCEAGLALLKERFKVPGTLPERVPLVLFAKEKDYRAFFPRLGNDFGATVSAPESDGYSILGFGGSWWDEDKGVDRPVLVHEAMHAALERLIFVGSDGNWVQEALASAVKLRLHPEVLEVDLGERFRKRDRGEPGFRPLSALLSTKRPGIGSYAQLLTVVEFLAAEHPDRLPAFWEAFKGNWRLPHESGPRALEKVLGAPMERIGAEWIAWGVKQYG